MQNGLQLLWIAACTIIVLALISVAIYQFQQYRDSTAMVGEQIADFEKEYTNQDLLSLGGTNVTGTQMVNLCRRLHEKVQLVAKLSTGAEVDVGSGSGVEDRLSTLSEYVVGKNTVFLVKTATNGGGVVSKLTFIEGEYEEDSDLTVYDVKKWIQENYDGFEGQDLSTIKVEDMIMVLKDPSDVTSGITPGKARLQLVSWLRKKGIALTDEGWSGILSAIQAIPTVAENDTDSVFSDEDTGTADTGRELKEVVASVDGTSATNGNHTATIDLDVQCLVVYSDGGDEVAVWDGTQWHGDYVAGDGTARYEYDADTNWFVNNDSGPVSVHAYGGG